MLILLEYAENGSLDKFLQTHELNEGQCLQMAVDVCSGLEYLHSKVGSAISSLEQLY
jgi:serine/threonine protein kinase